MIEIGQDLNEKNYVDDEEMAGEEGLSLVRTSKFFLCVAVS